MSSPSDQITAYGTVAVAVVAVVGLGLSLWTTRTDRRRADDQAANDRQQAQIAEERRYRTTLLLDLGHEIAVQQALAGSDPARVATQQIHLLLHALPAECAYTARQYFGLVDRMEVAGYVGEKMQRLKLSHLQPTTVTPDQMFQEIRYDLDHYEVDALGWLNTYRKGAEA